MRYDDDQVRTLLEGMSERRDLFTGTKAMKSAVEHTVIDHQFFEILFLKDGHILQFRRYGTGVPSFWWEVSFYSKRLHQTGVSFEEVFDDLASETQDFFLFYLDLFR